MTKRYKGKRNKGKVRVRRRRGSDRVPTRAKPSLDVGEVAATLFGDALDNAVVSRAFEERFVGKSVRWTGVLRRAERVSIDPVFGDEPITLATFVVFEPEVTGFTSRAVRAIVALVPAAHDSLSGREGEKLVFGGKLVACDPFGRSLYVAGGKLVGLVR